VADAPYYPCDRHGIPSYDDAGGTYHAATNGQCAGPERMPAPAGPDPERDRRRAAYRERERARAARALDRYIEVMTGNPSGTGEVVRAAGDRFVEAVGDYVLSRLGDRPEVPRMAMDPALVEDEYDRRVGDE
jgi:hypothetical protein